MQVKLFKGIIDILENDVEKMHQNVGIFESIASRLKSANTQAKIEAITQKYCSTETGSNDNYLKQILRITCQDTQVREGRGYENRV
jgi:hypothetical protein